MQPSSKTRPAAAAGKPSDDGGGARANADWRRTQARSVNKTSEHVRFRYTALDQDYMRRIWRMMHCPKVEEVRQFLDGIVFAGGFQMRLSVNDSALLTRLIIEVQRKSDEIKQLPADRRPKQKERMELLKQINRRVQAQEEDVFAAPDADGSDTEETVDGGHVDELLRNVVDEATEVYGGHGDASKHVFQLPEESIAEWMNLAADALRWSRAFGFVPITLNAMSGARNDRAGHKRKREVGNSAVLSLANVAVPPIERVRFALRYDLFTQEVRVVALQTEYDLMVQQHEDGRAAAAAAGVGATATVMRESDTVHVFTWPGCTPGLDGRSFKTPMGALLVPHERTQLLWLNMLTADYQRARPVQVVRQQAPSKEAFDVSTMENEELYGNKALSPLDELSAEAQQRARATYQTDTMQRALLMYADQLAYERSREQLQRVQDAARDECNPALRGGETGDQMHESTRVKPLMLPPGAEPGAFAQPETLPHFMELLAEDRRAAARVFGLPLEALDAAGGAAAAGRNTTRDGQLHAVQRVRNVLERERAKVTQFIQWLYPLLNGEWHHSWMLAMIQALLDDEWAGMFTPHELQTVNRELLMQCSTSSYVRVIFPYQPFSPAMPPEDVETAYKDGAISMLERINMRRTYLGLAPIDASNALYQQLAEKKKKKTDDGGNGEQAASSSEDDATG